MAQLYIAHITGWDEENFDEMIIVAAENLADAFSKVIEAWGEEHISSLEIRCPDDMGEGLLYGSELKNEIVTIMEHFNKQTGEE